ncbi:MAG: hypothetical protein KKD02_05785 [Alphaproteobacteria bacterium]|nr:hypothetical protein [Alphaproteobacteria bacterium]
MRLRILALDLPPAGRCILPVFFQKIGAAQLFDSIWSLLLIPLGLGLIGFVEPCSIGSSLLFLKIVEGKPKSTKLLQAVTFTLTRAIFIGLLGVAASFIGAAFFGFQKAGWMILGGLYVALGMFYLTGNAGLFMRTLGPSLRKLSTVRGTAGLGVLFGLNIPACAAPLLAALLGTATLAGSPNAVQGFVMLGTFGLALSLPLVVALLWAPARRALDRLSSLSGRVPIVIGLLFVFLGAWSIYFGATAI